MSRTAWSLLVPPAGSFRQCLQSLLPAQLQREQKHAALPPYRLGNQAAAIYSPAARPLQAGARWHAARAQRHLHQRSVVKEPGGRDGTGMSRHVTLPTGWGVPAGALGVVGGAPAGMMDVAPRLRVCGTGVVWVRCPLASPKAPGAVGPSLAGPRSPTAKLPREGAPRGFAGPQPAGPRPTPARAGRGVRGPGAPMGHSPPARPGPARHRACAAAAPAPPAAPTRRERRGGKTTRLPPPTPRRGRARGGPALPYPEVRW